MKSKKKKQQFKKMKPIIKLNKAGKTKLSLKELQLKKLTLKKNIEHLEKFMKKL